MGLTGRYFFFAAAGASAVLPLAALLLWHRVPGPRPLRALLRLGLIGLCQVAAVLVAGLVVNNRYQLYASWDDLLGRDGTPGAIVAAHPAVLPAAEVRPGAGQAAAASGQAESGQAESGQAESGQPTGGSAQGQTADELLGDAHLFHPYGAIPGAYTATVTGPQSGVTGTVLVWLPPQYREAQNARTDFPVIQLFSGFPGTPQSWLMGMGAPGLLDAAVAAGSAHPFVLVSAQINIDLPHDSDCSNIPGGPQTATWLARDVPRLVESSFRVAADRADWGLMGYSEGGLCTSKLLLQYPGQYRAGVSLSGDDHPDGDLLRPGTAAYQRNAPIWLIREDPPDLPVALLLTGTLQDGQTAAEADAMSAAAAGPVSVDLLVQARGGHNLGVWRALEPQAPSPGCPGTSASHRPPPTSPRMARMLRLARKHPPRLAPRRFSFPRRSFRPARMLGTRPLRSPLSANSPPVSTGWRTVAEMNENNRAPHEAEQKHESGGPARDGAATDGNPFDPNRGGVNGVDPNRVDLNRVDLNRVDPNRADPNLAGPRTGDGLLDAALIEGPEGLPDQARRTADGSRFGGGQRFRGPVVLRRGQVPESTTDQRLLDSRGPSDWRAHRPVAGAADPERVRRGFRPAGRARPRRSPCSARPAPSRTARSTRRASRSARRWPEAGYAVITGGGPGAMEAVNRGAMRGRRHLGRPRHRAAVRAAPQRLGRPRASTSATSSPARRCSSSTRRRFVIMPGGFGTLDELFEALTLVQTRKVTRFPVILFGTDYWPGWSTGCATRCSPAARPRPPDLNLFKLTDSPAEAVELIRSSNGYRVAEERAAFAQKVAAEQQTVEQQV